MPKKRISRVTTRTGDKGKTGLADGTRLDKDQCRVEVIGTIDELNSHLGLMIAHIQRETEITGIIKRIQSELFDVGGEICMPGKIFISLKDVERLEQDIKTLNAELPALPEFILPGGTIACAQAHVARTICRRAERRCVKLSKLEPIHPECLVYLNRLSDLLFVIARVLAKEAAVVEEYWQRRDLPQ